MATNASASLSELNDSILRLQHSSRRTIPMFLVGILATLIAAGAALYFILTLSTEARNSRQALADSQAALAKASNDLAHSRALLTQLQERLRSVGDAGAIKAAIANVSASQASVSSASTVVKSAAARLDATDPSVRKTASTPRLTAAHDSVTPENAPELTGEFVTIPTVDRFLVMRTQPSLLGAVIRNVPSGSLLKCAQAIPNENGNFWRPCSDDQGNSGYVANKFIRKH